MNLFMFLVTSVAIGVCTGEGNAELCRPLGQSWDVTCSGETSGVDRFIIWTYRKTDNENDTFIAQCYFDNDCVHENESRFTVRNSYSGLQVNSSLTVRNFTQSDEKLKLLCYIWDADEDVLTFQVNQLPALCSSTEQTNGATTTNRDNNQTDYHRMSDETTAISFTSVHIIVITAIAFIGIPLSVAVLVFVCRRWKPLLLYPSRGCLTNTYEDVRQFPLYYQQSSATQLPSYGGVADEHSFDDAPWDTDFEDDAGSTNGHVYLNGNGRCQRGEGEGRNEVSAEEEQSHRFLPLPQPCRFQVTKPSSCCSPNPSSGQSSPSSGVRSLFRDLLLVKSERCQTNMTSCVCHSDTGVTSPRRCRDVTPEKRMRGRGHSDSTGHGRETHRITPCVTCDASRGLVGCQTKSSNSTELRPCGGPSRSLVPLDVVHRSSERNLEHCEFGGCHNCSPSGNHSTRASNSPMGYRSHATNRAHTNKHGMGRRKHQRAANHSSTANPSPTSNHSPAANHSPTSKQSRTANRSPTNNQSMVRRSHQCAAKHRPNRGTEELRTTGRDNQPPNAKPILVHRDLPAVHLGSGNLDDQLRAVSVPDTTSQGDDDSLDYIEPRTSSASNGSGASGSVNSALDSESVTSYIDRDFFPSESDRDSITSGCDRGSVTSGVDRGSITSGIDRVSVTGGFHLCIERGDGHVTRQSK